MAISNVKGHKFSFSTSATKQDTTTAETMVYSWPLLSPHGATPVTTEFYSDEGEANDTSQWIESTTKEPSKRSWTKTINPVPYPEAIAFYGCAALDNVGTVGAAQIGTTGVYKHVINGPRALTGKFCAFTAQEDEVNGATNALNNIIHAVIVESMTITGTRGQPLSVAVNLRGGGNVVTAGGDAGVSAPARTKTLRFEHCHLFYNPAAGYVDTSSAGFQAAVSTSDSGLTASGLVNITSLMAGFVATFNNPPDVERSYQAGVADADGAAIIPYLDAYIEGGPQNVTLALTLDHDDSTESLAIMAGMSDGTQRGLELWCVNPIDQGSGAAAFGGFRITIPNAAPMTSDNSSISDDVGTKSVTHTFKSAYNATLVGGYELLTSSKLSGSLLG